MDNKKKKQKGEINLSLTVKTRDVGDGIKNPIDFSLNLNPDGKIIHIDESFSTKENLINIFKCIIDVIDKIEGRTEEYSSVLEINEETRKKLGFSKDAIRGVYDANFEPTFEKIDRIIYRHQSPGEASVSYARMYNGDKPPKAGGL